MLPALQRVVRLRRLIGADPRPFTPIARQPHARHRIHARMREIYALEAMLVEQLGQANADLERRLCCRS
jgi:hypothetical protein